MMNFLVTCGGGPGIVAIVESLKKSKHENVNIILADANRFSGNFFLDGVDKKYVIPEYNSNRFVDSITRIIQKEKVNYLYSGLDEELPILKNHENDLSEYGCKILLPPTEALLVAWDKWKTYQSLQLAGVKVPLTAEVENIKQAKGFYTDVQGHALIKAKMSRGGRRILIPKNLEEYVFFIEQILQEQCEQEYILQEMVSGVEYNVSSLHDKQGNKIYAYCRRKYDNRVVKSTTTAAAIENNPEIIEQAMIALTSIDCYPGLNNVEIIYDEAKQAPYVIEINAGRAAAQDMNLVAGGVNITDMLIDVINGNCITEQPAIMEGVMSLKIKMDMIVNYSDVLSIPEI